MSNRIRTISLSLLSLVLFVGCATESIKVRVMRPAPVNLAQHDTIAVDMFKGEGGELLSSELILALGSTKNPMTGKVDFEVMDRREIDKVLDDLRGSGGRNQRAMAVLDEWQNVEMHVTGEVLVYRVDETLSEKKWVDNEGVKHKDYSLKAVATVTAVIDVVNSSSDRTFDSVKFAEVASGVSTSVDTMPRPIDQAGLLEAARRKIVRRYLLRVTPREEYVQVKLFKDGDFPELHAGNGLARTGSWDGALERYHGALERMTGELAATRYKALFNIGVALEYSNQFDAAVKFLQEAYALEQDELILREIESVGAREEEYARLMEQV